MNINEETNAHFRALAKAIDQAWLKTCNSDFAEAVREYRQVEAHFAARAPDDEYFLTEMRRRIAESILLAAHSHEQPFDICRDAWNDLLRLGFTNFQRKCTESWFYADCCLLNEQFGTGLAVIEPLITEMEQSPEARGWDEKDFATLCKMRDELKAGIRD